MRITTVLKKLGGFVLPIVGVLSMAGAANALTIGETYTVAIEKVNSDGTVTSGGTSLGLSATATADSDGKISFTINGNVPDNGSCNFMVVSVANSSDVVERKGIVPCPDAGDTLPLGVSGVTAKQADALLAAFANAGSDDPILAVFGFTIVRSTGISTSELSEMASLAYQGISGTGGYVDYLTDNGVTSSQLANYRTEIVSALADPDSGYSKLMKDSVDVASDTDSDLEAAKRGEASAKLLSVLVQAATEAGFAQDRVLEAFNAMGAIVVPLMTASTEISNTTKQAINSSVGGGIQKLTADRAIEKYTQALASLGATGSDLDTYETAANNLVDTMTSAFAEFDKVFDGTETDADISAAESTLQSTMQTAFSSFMTATASGDTRLDTMIDNINTALGVNTGLTRNDFQFYLENGSQSNWPIMMVVPTEWVSTTVSNGGSVAYTRDDTAIPANLDWLGSCSNGMDFDRTSCEGNGGTWTAERTDYVSQGMPGDYAALFGIQEDIMILEFVRFDAQDSAGMDMSQHATLEKQFADSVAALADNVSGTSDGSTAHTDAVKAALIELMKSPQF